MLRFLEQHSADWVRLNRRMFSRVYPGGLRIASSNYNPVPAWCAGVQMAALNYQTPGLEMQLNHGETTVSHEQPRSSTFPLGVQERP